jgi:hypothetical protein
MATTNISVQMLQKIEGSLANMRKELADQGREMRAELTRISDIATHAHAGLGKVESQLKVQTEETAKATTVAAHAHDLASKTDKTVAELAATTKTSLESQSKALSDLQAQVTKSLGVEVKKTWKDHAVTVAKVAGLCVVAAASGAGGAYLMRESGDETFEAMPVNG